MKKILAAFLICVVSLFALSGCGNKYSAEDFIGKTSLEIEAEFGKFDLEGIKSSQDGLYKNTACGYTIKEKQKGFLGADPEILIFIDFDENGVATHCWEGYRPGG
jgi:hypothetical protein